MTTGSLTDFIRGAVRQTVTNTQNGKRQKVAKYQSALNVACPNTHQVRGRAQTDLQPGDLRASNLQLAITFGAEARSRDIKPAHPCGSSAFALINLIGLRGRDNAGRDACLRQL